MSSTEGRVRWFGESWGAPVCDPAYHHPTPVGQACYLWACGKPIAEGDQGVIMAHWGTEGRHEASVVHLDCFLDVTLGTIDRALE